MSPDTSPNPLWQPSGNRIAAAWLTKFRLEAQRRWHRQLSDYAALHRWSIDHPEEFWSLVWDFSGILGEKGNTIITHRERMPGARWFPEARLNFAENLLRPDAGDAGIIFRDERLQRRSLDRAALRRKVARLAAALRADGIQPGDRIAALMPNVPDTVVIMLAAASIGAIFTSASPDFGLQGILDRFGQIEPALLFVTESYCYNGKRIPLLDKVAAVAGQLPGLKRVIVCRHLSRTLPALTAIPRACPLADYLRPWRNTTRIDFTPLPFDHPLYILYSSGTTGVPKCIVHGAGGTLLQHLKEHRLHADIHPDDRVFYYTTCGWMMWNWLIPALASGAWVLLYDGNPFARKDDLLFDYAALESITHFGTSAKFIDGCAKRGLAPEKTHDLSRLRVILSTGSPLVPESFDYVHSHIKNDVQLSSISGGTDILSCFVGGNPVAPVWRGEIQCAGLGMAVDIMTDAGSAAIGEKGELVCTRPFPSMPLGFWNDPDGARYHAAYFGRFPGIWHHGDFAERTPHDGFIIHGRSDATLNPGGVRIGTAEIYRQVEKLPEIVESIVIGQTWQHDTRIILFVRLQPGCLLDDGLRERIRQMIVRNTTPRHAPAKILQVSDIPRTRSGKIVELAVRDVVHGRPVKNREALSNPEALLEYTHRPELDG